MKPLTNIKDEFSIDTAESSLQIKGVLWTSYSEETSLLVKLLKNSSLIQAQQELNNLLLHKEIGFLKELDGSFIMSLKNSSTGKSYLYKSLLCKSSVYYRSIGSKLIWSTNVFDLLDQEKSKLEQIKADSLLLTCFGETVMPNESHFKEISRLPAGHILIYEKGHISIKKIDYLNVNPPTTKNIFELAEQTRNILEETSRRRLNFNKPIGVLLSGGLDSAIALCVLKRIGAPVVAYHWSFRGIQAADELKYAKITTQHLDIPLYEIDAVSSIELGTYLNRDWKFTAPYNHGFYRLFEMTRDLCKEHGVESLASGYLGDVLFGPVSQDMSTKSLLNPLPLTQKLKYSLELMGTRWFGTRKQQNTGIHPRMSWYKDYMVDNATQIEKLNSYQSILSSMNPADFLMECADSETESVLESHLFHEKQMDMYHPFASRELMELSLSIPLPYKMTPTGGQWVDKSVLRLAYIGLLPPEIISRNHRQLMTAFNEHFIIKNRTQIKSLLINDSILSAYNIVSEAKLESLLNDKRKLAQAASGLICCCMTEIWLRNLSNHYTQKYDTQNVL